MSTQASTSEVKVWDPLVRIGHWLLVVAFFTNYIMEDEVMWLHSWIGYTMAGYVLIRIIWGFIGPRTARFSDFLKSPKTVFQFIKGMARGRETPYLGHNPAGGVMVVLLLLCMLGLTGSGMMLYALEEQAGPLATWVAEAEHAGPDTVIVADEHFWEETHEIMVNVLLGLVILHVLGVFVSSRLQRVNLVRAMVTGRKPAP